MNPNPASALQLWIKPWRWSFGWSRGEQLYWFARKSGPQRTNALKTACPNLGSGDSKDFFSDGSKMVWSAGGGCSSDCWREISGSQHHQPSGSNRSEVCTLVGNILLTETPIWWGFQNLQNSSKILLAASLEGEHVPPPKLHFCFLTSPLSLQTFLSLIRNCLDLPFGSQGRQHRKTFVSGGGWGPSHGVPLVVQSLSCVQLCNPVNCSMPGFPVLRYLPELAQTHVHLVSDAIQPSHPLSSPPPPALNLSQHQDLFQRISSLL